MTDYELNEMKERILGLEGMLREMQRNGSGLQAETGLNRLGQDTRVEGQLTVTGAIHGTADAATNATNADTLDGSHAAAFVPATRTISTASPLTGGGALSGNLTLDLAGAVYVPLSPPKVVWSGVAFTANQVFTLSYGDLGIPAGATAVAIRIAFSATVAGATLLARRSSTDSNAVLVARVQNTAVLSDQAGIVNCNPSGGFDLVCGTTAGSVYLTVVGYFI